MRRLASPAELAGLVGQELGVGRWQQVDQARVEAFAAVTGDHQWIHVDAGRAATGPYGGTLAHGMLTLALVPPMIAEVVDVGGCLLTVNREICRARFLSPVRAGDRVRGRVTLAASRPRARDYQEARYAVTVETEGNAEPALRAEAILLYRSVAD
ncbi:Acyl dehydratase [Micromonospora matsumotoense]|uniref:Acyl dehydratase n=1 Tax=Micromonospora matsumotoense TaxID=121616 RepID=A0A1C5AXC5_9ACTN|nr:MaoC family dehydratase [Micromonospora matsumotoense]SCF49701.1 Acyl dehydratase [Micromonospora matsumotoense]